MHVDINRLDNAALRIAYPQAVTHAARRGRAAAQSEATLRINPATHHHRAGRIEQFRGCIGDAVDRARGRPTRAHRYPRWRVDLDESARQRPRVERQRASARDVDVTLHQPVAEHVQPRVRRKPAQGGGQVRNPIEVGQHRGFGQGQQLRAATVRACLRGRGARRCDQQRLRLVFDRRRKQREIQGKRSDQLHAQQGGTTRADSQHGDRDHQADAYAGKQLQGHGLRASCKASR